MLESILSENLSTPKEVGLISSVATVIGFTLFFYTTGFSWIKSAVNTWRGDSSGEIVNLDELTRKIALLILIVNFSLVTDVITTIVNYGKDSIAIDSEKKDKAFKQLQGSIYIYNKYSHYFSLLEKYQNAEEDKKAGAKEYLNEMYPNGPSTSPNTNWVNKMWIGLKMSFFEAFNSLKVGIGMFFLYIGKFLALIFMYFFTIIFETLLALIPLAFAFSIPKSMENSYSTIIRRTLNVGIAFIVLNLFDAFVLNTFIEVSNEVQGAFAGDKSAINISHLNDKIFFALPVYCIALIGLYSSSLWVASAVTGGSDGEGGIATKGMSMGIGAIGGAVALGLGAKAAGKGLRELGKNAGKEKE